MRKPLNMHVCKISGPLNPVLSGEVGRDICEKTVIMKYYCLNLNRIRLVVINHPMASDTRSVPIKTASLTVLINLDIEYYNTMGSHSVQ